MGTPLVVGVCLVLDSVFSCVGFMSVEPVYSGDVAFLFLLRDDHVTLLSTVVAVRAVPPYLVSFDWPVW